MHIAILGAGALGCYYGARLQQSGHDVTFIARSEYEFLKQKGLQVTSIHGDISLPHVKVCRTPEEAGQADLVIVSWKSTANAGFADALPTLTGPHTIVLTLQNGMGNAEAIAAVIPANRICIGLCFVCAMRTKPGQVSHLEGGNIQFAPFVPSPAGSAAAKELAALFARANIKTKAFDVAEQIQWYKLVWNIPFNGLCLALGGISIAELYQTPENIIRARRIMEEVVQTAKARGYPLPADLVDFHLSRTESMGSFIPSSAVDYNEGRPVEYTAIWGEPLSKARQAESSVPEWERLDKDIRRRLNMD